MMFMPGIVANVRRGFHGMYGVMPGVLAAFLFTLVLNGPTLFDAVRGQATIMHVASSVDEQYYAALIRDVADGYPNLGHASLFEHRWSHASGSSAPLVQGALMKMFSWDIVTTVIVGDLLFPFVGVFLLFLIFRCLLPSVWLAAFMSIIVATFTDLGWMRSVTPQVTLPFELLFLFLLLAPGRRPCRTSLFRGLLLGCMFFTHIVHAVFFAIVESCDILRRFLQREHRWILRQGILFIGGALPFFLLRIMLRAASNDPVAQMDTERRLGMIASHLPAAPLLQGAVLAMLLLLLFLRRTGRMHALTADIHCTLLFGSLLALNQSLVHGFDIIFGLYYRPLITLILWLTGTSILVALLSRKILTALLSVLMMISFAALIRDALLQGKEHRRVTAAFQDSRIPDVLSVLSALPGERVLLAPLAVANLVPVLTPHYVLFNKYASYQHVRDEEIARRYALQEAIFPTSAEARGEGYNSVFGLGAGNSAARRKSFCRIMHALLLRNSACEYSIVSMIEHQEVFAWLDAALRDPSQLDLAALLREFRVDILLTTPETSVPNAVVMICRPQRKVGTFTIHVCGR